MSHRWLLYIVSGGLQRPMATWLTARVDSDVEAWVLPSGVVRVVNGVVVWRLWLVYALCGDCLSLRRDGCRRQCACWCVCQRAHVTVVA